MAASAVISAAASPSVTVEIGRAGDRARRQGGGGADDQPVGQCPDRDADGQRRKSAERRHRRHGAQPEPRAAPPRRCLRGRRRAALKAGLRAQQEQAEPDEHEREHRRGGRVETELVLGVDLRRERAESEQREGAVLGEQVQRDDQAAAEQCETQLRQRHAPEDREGAESLAARDVLERRVRAPQRGDRREHHERVVRERAHEHGAPEATDAVVQPDPGVAVDEFGHGERQCEQDRPEAAARHIGALEQPGDAGADDRAERRHEHDELDRVAQELLDVRQAQEVDRLRPAGARRLHADEREGQQQDRADGQRQQPQRCGTEAAPPYQRCRPDPAQCAHGLEQPHLLQHRERGLAVAELRRGHRAPGRSRLSGRMTLWLTTPGRSGYS